MSTTVGHPPRDVSAILDRHHRDPARLIPILHDIQAAYRYLPRDAMAAVARGTGISPAKVYGVATFYAHFALAPKGRYVVKLCDGTACHVKESIPILDALRKHLALKPGQTTTDDLLFTVETVSCLGACGLAPVLLINETVHGQMTPTAAVQLLKDIQADTREAA
jgi:NADH-quinone oxidoreductase subunit E